MSTSILVDLVQASAIVRSVSASAMGANTGNKSITVCVPYVLRECCEGAAELSLSTPNVRAALEELERRYPALHRSICDETGQLRRHINLFINMSHMLDRQGLDTALVPGDVISILPAVSGG